MSGTVGNNAGRGSGSVSDSLDATKLTGALPAISGANLTGISTDTSALEYNQAILAFKIASANQLAKFSMVDQVIDEYQDATGIDAGNSTNELAGGATTAKYYEGGSASTPTVTGGTITTSGDYTIHTFTSGTVNYVSDTTQLLDILVLAGGGGGGSGQGGGGGGAGGFKYFSQKSVAAATTAVTVGTGGAGSAEGHDVERGANGVNSSFGALVATGGGGAGYADSGSPVEGQDGGSGGGATRRNNSAGGSGTANQGNDGGRSAPGSATTDDSGGGGGGASSAGTNGANGSTGGNGGAGYTEGSSTVYDWTLADGTTATFNVNATGNGYAGGGSGGSEGGPSGSTSHGGGDEANGTDGRGGGGGGLPGSPSGSAYDGGDGVVVIRRLTSVTSSGANLTLQSTATTAEAAPTTADLVVLIEDGAGTATVNTDIKGYVSRDGSAFSSEVTFVDEGDWGTNKRILVARNIDISGITSGVAMKYKLTTHNQSASSKETRIHATSLAWA